jgi:hypothetical protein
MDDWQKMDDCYRGEKAVKAKGTMYLPATPGQLLDGMATSQLGWANYQGYKIRARFPDFVSQAVEGMLGVMHRKPAVIELPAKMKNLNERATVRGESLQMLLRRINQSQLVAGRCGLLADVPDGAPAGILPYIAIYEAKSILNWDDELRSDLKLVVLDESCYERAQTFEWSYIEKVRVLTIDESGKYQTGLFSSGQEIAVADLLQPSLAGTSLEKIPFIIVNSKDIIADPDDPPLLGLAELALAVYRGEADYRQALFMQGQDTLVIIGSAGNDEIRAGAGGKIEVGMGGDAKYIGVSSQGLSEMRSALENDKREAADIGGRLLDTAGSDAESGDALRIRVAARTASLNQLALTGAEALQAILRTMAEWVGADPKQVTVTPNLDFSDDKLGGQELVQIMTAKGLGAPLSKKSVHAMMKRREMTELTFEEEMDEIEVEAPELSEPEPSEEDDAEDVASEGDQAERTGKSNG